MSGAVGPSAGYATLASLIGDSTAISTRLATLQQQSATGTIAPTLGGLGSASARQVLDLTPAIAHDAQYQTNIDAVQGQLATTQVALKSISDIANTFYAQLPNLNGLNASSVDVIAANAKQALAQIANLIDTKSGDTYVFAGQTPGTPPIPNPDAIATSPFATGIATAVASLGTNGAAATAAATLATATATSPFDPALSTRPPTVQTGPTEFTQAGLLATTNTLATSTGPSTTGSYMRDVLRSLATLAALSSTQLGAPGFPALIEDTRQSLTGAIGTLNTEAGALGNTQTGLQTTRTELGNTADALKSQLSSATEVDMAATLSALTQTQTQLQASYQVIAAAKALPSPTIFNGRSILIVLRNF